jgi:hypothetical protein
LNDIHGEYRAWFQTQNIVRELRSANILEGCNLHDDMRNEALAPRVLELRLSAIFLSEVFMWLFPSHLDSHPHYV